MGSRILTVGWKLVDVLFPPRCAGCGEWGKRYCSSCFQKIRIIKPPICSVCGEPLNQGQSSICERCSSLEYRFSAVRSWGYFGGSLQKAIHRLKYKRDICLGEILAQPLVELLHAQDWNIDLITVVPLDKRRSKERGYNQGLVLAKPIGWISGLMVTDAVLKRVKITRSQVGLSVNQRKENVNGAFKAHPELISGKNILVIDDVMTTGSTINACADALLKANAEKVYAITLARSTRL